MCGGLITNGGSSWWSPVVVGRGGGGSMVWVRVLGRKEVKNMCFYTIVRIYNLQDSLSELVSLSEISLLPLSETFTLSKISLLARIALSELVLLSKLLPLERIALSCLVSLSELFQRRSIKHHIT